MIALIIIFIIAVLFYCILNKRKQQFKELASILPGPNPLPIIGNMLIFAVPQKELLRKFNEVEKLYKSPTRYWIGPDLYISIKKPNHIETILTSTSTVKGDVYEIIRDCIGDGLIQSNGIKHKVHRRIMSAPLKGQVLEKFTNIFDAKGKECVSNFKKYEGGELFDVLDDVERSTMALVCETILGLEMKSENVVNEDLIKTISGLYKSISERMYKLWLHPHLTFRMSKHYKIQKEGMKSFYAFLEMAIREKRKNINKLNGDMQEVSLQKLLDAKDDNSANILSDDEIKEELTTLFTASEDTTTTVTSFVLLMLAMHQDVQNIVWEEQVRLFGSNDNSSFNIEPYHLKNMTYLHMVIEEVLRLFPVAPLILRKVKNDLNMGEYKLKENTNIIINIFAAHRDETIWPEPEKFDPLRFTSEEKSKRDQYTYLPFSGGLRSCIGKPFAFMSIKCIVSHIIRNYSLYSEWKMEDLVLEADISVRSTNGYKIKIERRKI